MPPECREPSREGFTGDSWVCFRDLGHPGQHYNERGEKWGGPSPSVLQRFQVWNTADALRTVAGVQESHDEKRDRLEARALIVAAIDGPSKVPFPVDLNSKLA